jgi:lysozyme family protein
MGLFDFLKKKYRFPKVRTPEFYREHINNMAVQQPKLAAFNTVISELQRNRVRYEKVSQNLHIPWKLVAVIHYAKDLCDFRRDLETGHTYQQENYKTWEEAATVSIGRVLEKFTGNYAIKGWSFEEMLALAEDYFEQGYYEKGILSPILWAGTNNYLKGRLTGNHFEQDDLYYRLGVAPLVQLLYVCEGEELERLV